MRMNSNRNLTLVLMRDASIEEPPMFVADLYSGNKIEDSVYLDREAMLRWIFPMDSKVEQKAARAMDMLLSSPEHHSMYSIPLSVPSAAAATLST